MNEPAYSDVGSAVNASSLAEVSWVAGDGTPRVRGVVALLRDERPVLAFTYADAEAARSLGSASRAVLTLTERRSTGTSFRPVALAGQPSLAEDPEGEVFVAELVTQELRRYPPARLFADSPLLMREHWWYLPRLLVEIAVDTVEPVEPRVAPHDHLLVVADGGRPAVRAARVEDQAGERLGLEVVGEAPAAGPAVVFGQDASFPDLDQWAQWRWTGRWDGRGMLVEKAPVSTGLGRPPGVVQRWKRQRAFERRCTEAIPRR
ncbi:MAG: hypothetical protein ACTHKG_12070 [Nocardioides sp.]